MPIDATDSLLVQGIELAIFGMGTVFVFLGLLVFATILMSRVARKLAPSAAAEHTPHSVGSPPLCDEECVAVVGAAVIAHRMRGKC